MFIFHSTQQSSVFPQITSAALNFPLIARGFIPSWEITCSNRMSFSFARDLILSSHTIVITTGSLGGSMKSFILRWWERRYTESSSEVYSKQVLHLFCLNSGWNRCSFAPLARSPFCSFSGYAKWLTLWLQLLPHNWKCRFCQVMNTRCSAVFWLRSERERERDSR